MSIDDDRVRLVQDILSAWNPLGEQAESVPDLDNYSSEAGDIIFGGGVRATVPRPQMSFNPFRTKPSIWI